MVSTATNAISAANMDDYEGNFSQKRANSPNWIDFYMLDSR